MPAEEVCALVVEVGTSSTKAGYAGEDTPRSVFPTECGILGSDSNKMDTDGNYRFGDDSSFFTEHMEIKTPLSNGLVSDWDLYAQTLDFAFEKQLREPISESPLVICEPSFNTSEQRLKLAEIAFEKLNTPAFFLCRNGVLSAFASGKSSALVIDIGAGMTTVTPVYDGYVIKKGVVYEPVAGNFLTREAMQFLDQQNVNTTPHFKIARRKPVDFGKPAEVTLKKLSNVTASFETSQKMKVINDFKETVCAVSDVYYNESVLAVRPMKSYEFPSGYNGNFGLERYKIPEILFNPKIGTYQDVPDTFAGIPAMIQNSLNTVDVDVRPHLLSNIIVVGGSSSFLNLADRLNNELVRYFPGSKIRLYSPGTSAERKFSNWIGGSILASLGTFQQLWISKQEYEEHGGSIVDKRCG